MHVTCFVPLMHIYVDYGDDLLSELRAAKHRILPEYYVSPKSRTLQLPENQ